MHNCKESYVKEQKGKDMFYYVYVFDTLEFGIAFSLTSYSV